MLQIRTLNLKIILKRAAEGLVQQVVAARWEDPRKSALVILFSFCIFRGRRGSVSHPDGNIAALGDRLSQLHPDNKNKLIRNFRYE